VLTDVSEEGIASIFRVEKRKSASEEPAWTGANRLVYCTLKMEEIRSSETSVIAISLRRHIPEDCFLQIHSVLTLIPYLLSVGFHTILPFSPRSPTWPLSIKFPNSTLRFSSHLRRKALALSQFSTGKTICLLRWKWSDTFRRNWLSKKRVH
jgi:hypothetical protein